MIWMAKLKQYTFLIKLESLKTKYEMINMFSKNIYI